MAGETTLFGGEIHCPNAPTAYNAGTFRKYDSQNGCLKPAPRRRKAQVVIHLLNRGAGFSLGRRPVQCHG